MLRGRPEHLSVALSALTASQVRGEGSVIQVTGVPGIGKTAFLRAVLEQARRRGFGIGYAAADHANQLVPGAAMLLALRSGTHPLVDRVSFRKLTDPALQPLWLAEDVADLLDRRAQSSPVLIVLDDLQWSDPLSRFLLRVLPGRLAAAPVVWLLASRSGQEVDPFGGERIVDGVATTPIELGPLAVEDLIELAADILNTAPSEQLLSWLAQIDGNPFLATELAEGARQHREKDEDDTQLPPSFAGRLRNRLTDVGDRPVSLLRLAAAWGGPLPVPDAQQLMGTDADGVLEPLDAAVQAGLLDPSRDAITFRHDLVREFVYSETPPAERARLHRLVADHLLAHGHRPIEVAQHAAIGAASGDRSSIDILRRAAVESMATVPHTAAHLMHVAFAAVDVTDPEWSRIGEQYAVMLRQAQRGGDAISVVDTLLTRTERQDDRARLQVLAVQALWLVGRPQEMVTRTDNALSLPSVGPAVRIRLAALRALALSRTGDPAEAAEAADAALIRARQLDDRAAEVTALHALAETARNQGQHSVAYQRFHELRTSLGADFLPQEILSLQHLDRFEEAQHLLDPGMHRAARSPDAQSPALASAQVWQLFNLGQFESASAAAKSLIRLGDELGNYVHRQDARIAMIVCAMIRGDLPGARSLVDRAEVERPAAAGAAPGLLLVRARIADAEGRSQDSREFLRQMDSDTTSAHLYWSRSLAQFRLRAGVALAVGDQELAEQTRAQSAAAAARNSGVPSYQGIALHISGMVTDDLDELGAGADILQRCPRPAMGAIAAADFGKALLRAGHRDDGISRLEQALKIYDAIGYVAAAAGVQRELSLAGISRRRRNPKGVRPVTGWASLTETEATVARLVADGHTNRSAGQALGISVNTVGTHLNSVFAKLSVRSRLQLSHAVRQVGSEERRPDATSP